MFTLKKTKKVLNNIKKFNKKKFNYNKYVKEFYVEKGIAHVYANVTSYDDIISRYSVKNYEVLNDDFINYLEQVTYYIPIVYPVVLSIEGCKFSLEEEKIIEMHTITEQIGKESLFAEEKDAINIASKHIV